MFHGQEAQPGPEGSRLTRDFRHAFEPALVHDLGDEPAHVRMHAPRALEEHAHVRRDGRVLAEQVLEDRRAGAFRMRPLRDLGELERVAEQHDVACGRSHRQRIGERHLPGLVDHQGVDRGRGAAVQALVGEEPGGSGEEHRVRGGGERRDVGGAGDRAAVVERLVVAGGRLLETAEAKAFLGRRLLHLGEQVVDRLVARRGDPDAPALAHELGDQARAGPRLAGSRRALDEEVARVQPRHERALGGEIDRLHRAAGCAAANARGLSLEDVAQRGVAAVVGEDRGWQGARARRAARASSRGLRG